MNNCGVGFADILYFVRFANSIIINYSFFILHYSFFNLSRELTYDLSAAGKGLEIGKRDIVIARIEGAQAVAHEALEVAFAVSYKDTKLAAFNALLLFDEDYLSVREGGFHTVAAYSEGKISLT